MEKDQEIEWGKAQGIEISVKLVTAAKRQLDFLSAVDRNRFLYEEGPYLERAIYRYNAFWLPLLAKHSESPLSNRPLVVPLDCEWIWHCHRLNPVQYKSDCEELYGSILDNANVVSTIGSSCTRETEEIWKKLYPQEPFNFIPTGEFPGGLLEALSGLAKYTKYDLVLAVKRQSPFFYQVSRPHMDNDIFLQEAVARYKGFLYLIKRNREKSIKCFCVPTYDIDLIWHSHQLNPLSYCKDLRKVLGEILEHNDMDSDRTKGKKLDTGFSGTTKQWEQTFGTRYWKAGAMYRGSSPSPLMSSAYSADMINGDVVSSKECRKIVHLPQLKAVEVLLEFVGVKNLPEGLKGNLFVQFNKSQPDALFSAKWKLSILSETGEKRVASFQCEPKGELHFELLCYRSSNIPLSRTALSLGSISLPLEDIFVPFSKMSIEKWLELKPGSGCVSSKPIVLRVAISFTVPNNAPRELQMVKARELSGCSRFIPFSTRMQHTKGWTQVIDEAGDEVISLQLKNPPKAKEGKNTLPNREVIGVTTSGESCKLAEFVRTGWSLFDAQWLLDFKKSSEDVHLFKLVGNRLVKFFQGRKMDYEPRHCEKHKSEQEFITAVEFSAKYPYGRAVALFDLKYGVIKVKEEWMVVPGIMTAFILLHTWKKEGYGGLAVGEGKLEVDSDNVTEKVHMYREEDKRINQTNLSLVTTDPKVDVSEGNLGMPVEGQTFSSGCGGCGGGCGNMVTSGGCGGCGGGCGNMVTSGGCGGCGGGCGNIVTSGGCGGCGGCGGGCGNMVTSGGCGGCGSGFGNMVKSDDRGTVVANECGYKSARTSNEGSHPNDAMPIIAGNELFAA